MTDYPKPPFDTKITLIEDPGPGSNEDPIVIVMDLNEMSDEELDLAVASGSDLAAEILAFRATNQDQKS
jgi:hypothetical protein